MIGSLLCWCQGHIGRLLCWCQGHKRGKFVIREGSFNIFQCPRCKRPTKYKVISL